MEKELVDEYLTAISDKWNIYREVWGINKWSKNKKRIDAIIVCKEFPTQRFGIEFKREKVDSFHYFTRWFKQAVIYSQTEWDGFGKLVILMAPGIQYHSYNKDDQMMLSRIVGEFGIGEFKKEIYNDWQGNYKKTVYKLVFKQDRVWCSEYGWNNKSLKQNFNQYLEL